MRGDMKKYKKGFIYLNYRIKMLNQESVDKIIREHEKIFRSLPLQWDLATFERKLSLCLNNDDIDVPPIGSLFIPSYQRNYIWGQKDQSLFIESLLLNIPIPYVFLNEDSKTWRTEIVDWYQRIRTIYEFINNSFSLQWLEKLDELNWLTFEHLSPVRQQLFLNKTLNIILFQDLDDDQKKEMFSRINATWELLNYWEQRKWIIWWPFYQFMCKLSEEKLSREMLVVSTKKEKREEIIELILRFFAYTENFYEYSNSIKVYQFLDNYMKKKNEEFRNLEGAKLKEIKKEMGNIYINMLSFVKDNVKNGFKKNWKRVISSRTYYEALSVWVWLSMKEKSRTELNSDKLRELIKSKKFQEVVSSGSANNVSKFQWRILAVKHALVDWVIIS